MGHLSIAHSNKVLLGEVPPIRPRATSSLRVKCWRPMMFCIDIIVLDMSPKIFLGGIKMRREI